jgi:hypothetical protein
VTAVGARFSARRRGFLDCGGGATIVGNVFSWIDPSHSVDEGIPAHVNAILA